MIVVRFGFLFVLLGDIRTFPGVANEPAGCGVKFINEPRIINGVDAIPGAWPWMVSFQHNKLHVCGATLLNPKWVITASHCVDGIENKDIKLWSVKMGINNLHIQEKSVQERPIKRIVQHPNWEPRHFKADLALLELMSPVKLTDRVNLICLPREPLYPQIGKECYITGWGSIKYPGNIYHILQQVRLPIVNSSKCKYQKEVVCVGNGRKNRADGSQQPNACQGDSGGPLMCRQLDGSWQLEGVASFVRTYCKYFTAFAPVNKYTNWINKYVN